MSAVVDASKGDLRTISAELRKLALQGPVTVRRAAQLHGLLAGFKQGELTVDGDAGDYLGVLNDGATIRVTGNAGRYLADNMTAGLVTVEGDAGDGVGQYCYGGTIVIRGSAGDFSAVINRGATVVVEGDVGDEVATYMLAGKLVILGNAGTNLGNYLIRGTIYIAGSWAGLGHNTVAGELADHERERLQALLARHAVKGDLGSFTKIAALSEKPFYKPTLSAQPDLTPLPVPSGTPEAEQLCHQ